MSELTPITREEALLSGADLEPITREEMFIRRIYDKTQMIPEPITRREMFLKLAGEGGSDVEVVELVANQNGTYVEEGKAFSPVTVAVPQLTTESLNVTENGTYNAPSGKAYSSVEVDVPTGGNENAEFIATPINFKLNTNIKSINIPSGVTSIVNGAFQGCYNLESINIPSGVTSIGSNAFETCDKVESIEFPSSVSTIGNTIFSTSKIRTSLRYIFKGNVPPTTDSDSFRGNAYDRIYVPDSSINTYK